MTRETPKLRAALKDAEISNLGYSHGTILVGRKWIDRMGSVISEQHEDNRNTIWSQYIVEYDESEDMFIDPTMKVVCELVHCPCHEAKVIEIDPTKAVIVMTFFKGEYEKYSRVELWVPNDWKFNKIYKCIAAWKRQK